MNRFELTILFSLFVSVANAQDIHFTQWMHAPHTYSPSSIGDFDQAIRLHHSPADRKRGKKKNIETSPAGFLTEDGKNVASKKISAIGPGGVGIEEESPEQMYYDGKNDSMKDVNIQRVIYNKNL